MGRKSCRGSGRDGIGSSVVALLSVVSANEEEALDSRRAGRVSFA